jgi:hypothetical protein
MNKITFSILLIFRSRYWLAGLQHIAEVPRSAQGDQLEGDQPQAVRNSS